MKANQGQLYRDVVELFADLVASGYRADTHDHAVMFDKGQGHLARRAAWISSDPKQSHPIGGVSAQSRSHACSLRPVISL